MYYKVNKIKIKEKTDIKKVTLNIQLKGEIV